MRPINNVFPLPQLTDFGSVVCSLIFAHNFSSSLIFFRAPVPELESPSSVPCPTRLASARMNPSPIAISISEQLAPRLSRSASGCSSTEHALCSARTSCYRKLRDQQAFYPAFCLSVVGCSIFSLIRSCRSPSVGFLAFDSFFSSRYAMAFS